MKWTDADIACAVRILGRYAPDRYRAAVDAIAGELGRAVAPSHVKNAFLRRGMSSPTTYLGGDTSHGRGTPRVDGVKAAAATPAPRPLSDIAERVLRLTKGHKTATLEEVANALDLSPMKTHKAVEEARAAGYAFEFAHGRVAFKLKEVDDTVQAVKVAQTKGAWHKVAVISDTHLGSKYCLRPYLVDFIKNAYADGVREVLHPGDVIDGCYRHGVFELTHSGIDEQTRDLLETLPQLDGLTYSGITGNHDDTFSDHIGIDAGLYMQRYFESHGRKDLKFYGRRGARLRMHGVTVELWHPKKGGAYALSYGLQNHIRDYGVGHKPDICLAGHLHTQVYFQQRGVHALQCGTFQGAGSAFSKSLGGSPAIGGHVLSWKLTPDGTIRRFGVEHVPYYEHERPRDVKGAA